MKTDYLSKYGSKIIANDVRVINSKSKDVFTVKKRFAYIPMLVWDVPLKYGMYYRFIWLKYFFTIQKKERWMLSHTYANEFAAKQRALNFNAGYVYKNGTFYNPNNL